MRRLIFILALAALACSAPLASLAKSPTASPSAEILPTVTQELPTVAEVTAIEALHVRKQPLGIVIGYLFAADTVTLTDKCSDGWAQIEWRDGTAWVKAKYLSENSCQTNKE